MATNNLSIQVCGRPSSSGGFSTVYIKNSKIIDDKTEDRYEGFGDNSYFFTVKIENSQVIYKLVKNNIFSNNSSRSGWLQIAIAIPKGYKLDSGVSPYDVLMELKKGFLARCMTCKDFATEKYEFSSERAMPTILDDIANLYSLVPVQMPYRPMTIGAPKAYIIATEDKIEQLMEDVQYPAFTKFGEIVVAASVQGTKYTPIPNIAIPRMPEYSIYYDGVLQPKVVSDPKKLLTVDGTGDTRFFENESLMFTLEELLNGENVPNVSIDIANEIINVSTKALIKPITRKINVVFVPKEAETYFFTRRNEWGLFYGNQSIPLEHDLSFELSGEQLQLLYTPKNFKIQQSRKDQYEVKVTSVSSKEIRITAEKICRTVGPIGGGGRIGGGVVQTPSINAYEVLLTLDQAYKRSRCSVQFFNSEGVLLQSTTALFARDNDGNHISRVYVPKSWSGCNVQVRLKYKNEYWYSNNYLGRDINGVIELRDKDFSRKSIGFFSKHSREIVLLTIFLLGLLLGAAGMYFGKDFLGSKETSNAKTDIISCTECGKICADQAELTLHMSEKHPDNGGTAVDTNYESTLTCPDCGAGPFNQTELDDHKSKCPKKFKCDKCGDGFASDGELRTHKETKHPVAVAHSFKCDKCDREFTSAVNLNAHKNQVHAPKKCKLCGKTFNGQNALSAHKQTEHHFVCKQCGSDTYFATQNELDAHMRGKRKDGNSHLR